MTAPAEGPSLDIDRDRLAEMLALVGPASEERLLRSLIEDLGMARAGLLQAASGRDPEALRRQTHVLSSLAATFGASALNQAARALQSRSQTADGGRTPMPDPGPVVRLTDRLIAELNDRLADSRP